jgi:hypothetical protein
MNAVDHSAVSVLKCVTCLIAQCYSFVFRGAFASVTIDLQQLNKLCVNLGNLKCDINQCFNSVHLLNCLTNVINHYKQSKNKNNARVHSVINPHIHIFLTYL